MGNEKIILQEDMVCYEEQGYYAFSWGDGWGSRDSQHKPEYGCVVKNKFRLWATKEKAIYYSKNSFELAKILAFPGILTYNNFRVIECWIPKGTEVCIEEGDIIASDWVIFTEKVIYPIKEVLMEEKKFIVSVNEKAKNNLPPEELKQIVNCIQSFWRIKFVCPFCGSNDVIINFYIRPEDFIFELEITCLGCKGITEHHMFSTCVRVIDRIGDIDSMIDRWYQRIKYYHYLKSALPERFALEVRARNEGNNVFLDDEARAKNCMITVSYNEDKGKWTEDYRDEDEAELNHCRCGGIAVMVKIVMEFGAYEVYDDYLYIVECPICGRRTRPYEDSNAAVCEWNGVEYTPHVETGRQRTEEEKECDKMLADLPDPMTSALKLLSEKKEFVGGDAPVIEGGVEDET